MEQEVGGSSPPNCTTKINYLRRTFDCLASQIFRFGKRLGGPGSLVPELRAMERLCPEQAELCVLPVSREALEGLALNYRAAAERQRKSAAIRCWLARQSAWAPGHRTNR